MLDPCASEEIARLSPAFLDPCASEEIDKVESCLSWILVLLRRLIGWVLPFLDPCAAEKVAGGQCLFGLLVVASFN